MADLEDKMEWLMPCEALTRYQPEYDYTIYQQGVQVYQTTRYGYRIGNERFVVSEGVTSEVLENNTIFPLPLTDRLLSGLINLRGNLIPVYDLSDSNTWVNPTPYKHRVLVLKNAEGEVGVKIDDLPKPIRGKIYAGVQDKKIEKFVWNDHITNILSAEGKLWYEMNCHTFLINRATQGENYSNQSDTEG